MVSLGDDSSTTIGATTAVSTTTSGHAMIGSLSQMEYLTAFCASLLSVSPVGFSIAPPSFASLPLQCSQTFGAFANGIIGSEIRINAMTGSVSDYTSLALSAQPATAFRCFLVSHHGVWSDYALVQVAVQARDSSFNVQTLGEMSTIQVSVWPITNTLLLSTGYCTPELLSGFCIVSVHVPESWFSLSANESVSILSGFPGMLSSQV